MQKFEICYPILNLPDTYIAPSLLPEDRPEYAWNTDDNLILSYQYEFMPKGIVTRFIVETHDLIETPNATKPANQLVWKKGVILSDRYARAEIIEDYSKKEIRIRVAGLQRKSLLAVIQRGFKKIHKSFEGSFNQLDYHEMIHCNCPTCDRTQDPYAYPLDELLSFIADKDWEIQCRRKGRHMVDVRRLLNEFSIDDREIDRKNPTPTTITPNPPNIYIEKVEHMSSNINPSNPNFQGDLVIGDKIAGDKVMRDKIGTQINNNPDLVQAAKEIQAILDQLSETYNPNTPTGQQNISNQAIEQIKQNPSLKSRITKAVKEGTSTAFTELIDHPTVTILTATFKGFIEGE